MLAQASARPEPKSVRTARTAAGASLLSTRNRIVGIRTLAPHTVGDTGDEVQLPPHRGRVDLVAVPGGGEAALGRDRQPVEIQHRARLLEAMQDLALGLQARRL